MKQVTPVPQLSVVLQMIEEEVRQAQPSFEGRIPLEPTDFRKTVEMQAVVPDTLPN